MEIALVLSGGGALGVAHVGVLRALEENKFKFRYLIGTSAGAIVCASIACGLSAEEISSYLRDKRLLKLAFDFSFRGGGILRGNKVLALLREVFKDKSFEDLPSGTCLRICATNFETGEGVVISSGSIAEAVRASLSVPGLFEPFWINGVPLVDGGLVSNLPLKPALLEYQGDKILAVDVCTSMATSFKKNISIKKSIERSFKIIFKAQQNIIAQDPRLNIVRPNLENFSTTDILKFKEMEEQGYLSAQSLFLV